MSIDFYNLLKVDDKLLSMPGITIKPRLTDKFVNYNKRLTRLDRIAGEIYEDDTLTRIILWANPEYYLEFDIPDNTIIRVPYPLEEVIQEVIIQINKAKNIS